MSKKNFDVSYEQLAHEFTMLKMSEKCNASEINTYGDLIDGYIDELDTCKAFLKSIYGEDIFTK